MLQDKDLLSIQEVRTKVEKAHAAAQKYRHFTQEQVDRIVEQMAAAARAQARRLAELAVQETGYGNVPDKIAKNLLNADILPRRMRGMKTIGVLRELTDEKVIEVGVPMGVVAAILPTTNPTSTVIFKTLISLKAGNAIVISPHPNAKECTCETAGILYQAALEAGAPEDIIQCILTPTSEATQALMHHERVGVILATGGSAMVTAAYSSGTPALGVGPGNVPVLFERSADVVDAVRKVVEGKSFDYGTVCSSEQAIVAEEVLRDQVILQLKAEKAYFCNEAEKDALRRILLTPRWTVNPKCVGQSPTRIAELAGFRVPDDTRILVAEIAEVGKSEPLSAEKLSPVLSLYFVKDFAEGLARCESLLRFGGLGHTCVIYSKDDAKIREFGMRMPAFRVLVNTPAPQGSTGITTNVFPSMTLGCGAMSGNSTSDNVGPQHLFNIKRIAYAVRSAEEAFEYKPEQAAATATPGRAAVAAAVDRFLAQRGLSLRAEPAPAAAASPASAPVASAVVGNVAAQVVDRFLAARQAAQTPAPAASSAPTCGCEVKFASPAPAAPAAEPPAAIPAPPPPAIVDFVCEDDVRRALAGGRKIFIGPRTIVTPSARDLANQHDVLVAAQR
jgi:acetaldehyde dehydrogenase (acetylating)